MNKTCKNKKCKDDTEKLKKLINKEILNLENYKIILESLEQYI